MEIVIDFDNWPAVDDEFSILQDIYTKGDDVQKLSVIQNLPQLIVIDSNATFNRILPRVIQELPKATCEFHIATSRVFKLLTEKQLPLNLLVPTIQGFESRDILVANSWLDTLLATIPNLTVDLIKRDVLPLAQSKATMSKSIFYRMASCKMFGKICAHPKVDQLEAKKTILPLVQSLCQDVNADVRAAMCAQLPYVAKAIGDDVVKSGLISNVVELASDENIAVRSASVLSIVDIIMLLNKETKVNIIIPLVKHLCSQSIDEGDTSFTVLSKEYGRILDVLQNDLRSDDCLWFLQFYKNLSQRGFSSKVAQADSIESSQGVICRQQCAYNLPALTFFTVIHLNVHLNLWYSVFRELAGDPCYLVRKTVAGCIHEIAKILGTQCKMIKQDIVRLLRDDAEEVLQMLVPNLGTTLELFGTYGLLSRDTPSHTTLEIGRAVLKCQMELSSGHNWRMLTQFMYELEHLPNCMPSDFIHQHFTPVILNIAVQGRARPVRVQAAKTLLVFLRYNSKEIQRKWIRDTLIARLCYADSCYTRHIYVKMCLHALDIFSNKYFKDFFYVPLLGLAEDPVSNIRLSVISLIPNLKIMLLPEDRKLQQCLDTILTKLETAETDKDILLIYRTKMKDYKSLQENSVERTEDRRKQDEESKIAEGKAMGPIRRTSKPPSFMGLETTTKQVAVVQRPASAPPQSVTQAKSVPSDMSFLDQHFYIDAGISLPNPNKIDSVNMFTENSAKTVSTHQDSSAFADADSQMEKLKITSKSDASHDGQASGVQNSNECNDNKRISDSNLNTGVSDISQVSTVSLENTNIDKLSQNDLHRLEESTTNITDDVKVNLRRMKSSNIPNISTRADHIQRLSKRHSTIMLSSHSDASSTRKASNRRSLNITKDLSRIPVSFNGGRTKSLLNVAKHDCDKNVETPVNNNSINGAKLDCDTITKVKTKATKGDNLNMNGEQEAIRKIRSLSPKNTVFVSQTVGSKEYVPVNNKSSSGKALDKNGKENISRGSSLPVFIKRTVSETRGNTLK